MADLVPEISTDLAHQGTIPPNVLGYVGQLQAAYSRFHPMSAASIILEGLR